MKLNVASTTANKFSFIDNGGEAGALILQHDWQNSALGAIEQWPLSLRTTLSILLHSAFPMLLFWGEDLICFYNDAFRPSLGNDGKHPAIGKPGKVVWSEIWEFIGPLLQQVITTGKPIWYEDQLVPFYRNGRVEDIYWTFSYSPAYDDDGQISGVFVTCTETTERMLVANKLKASEQRFQNLIYNATVGIIVLAGENLIIEIANKAYGKLINRHPEELLGKPLFSIIPEMQPYFEGIIQTVRITGKPLYLYDHPYFYFDNGIKKEGYLNLVYQPYKKDADAVESVMILCQDVKEHVIARKNLEKSEQRVRSIVESAPFPIGVYTGREMRIELANQSILDVWGKGNNVIGKLYSEVLPELANQSIYEQLDDVYMKGIAFHARNQRVDIVVKDKLQPFYFNYSFTPLHDADGNIYGVMNTAAEVTDLNLAWQKLAQSEANFRNMILQAPVAMCILLGPDHVVEVANTLMLQLWGKPTEAVMQRPIFDGLPEVRRQGLEEVLADVFANGNTFKADERPVGLLRNGIYETVYQNFVYEPYRDGVGNILGVFAITVDVTAQVLARQKIEEVVKARTQELADANSNLQRSNAELAQFAYIASHDLQEPARKVASFAQLLATEILPENITAHRYIDKIKKASASMLSLVRDVLAYSQLSDESRKKSSVNLNEVIADIQNDLELLIAQKNASVRYTSLPTIQAIPLQMSQLFSNLISNALKFSKDDEPCIIHINSAIATAEEVSQYISNAENKTFYSIKVADNGIGFSEENADKIFQIFQRLHGRHEYDGTGIGLALCKKIVLNHGGDIYATSTEGNGASFHVLLPVNTINN